MGFTLETPTDPQQGCQEPVRGNSRMSRSAVAVRHVLFEDLGIVAPLLTERGYSIRYLGLTTPNGTNAELGIFSVSCGDPDHDVRCTFWAPRSRVVVCMLEGCITAVPRASNSLFTDK